MAIIYDSSSKKRHFLLAKENIVFFFFFVATNVIIYTILCLTLVVSLEKNCNDNIGMVIKFKWRINGFIMQVMRRLAEKILLRNVFIKETKNSENDHDRKEKCNYLRFLIYHHY